MLYTDKAAQRLLGNAADAQITEATPDGAFVTWNADDGECKGFIPKSKFVELFIGDRKARARGIEVTRNAFYPDYYTARNTYNESTYNLVATDNAVQCQCPDYAKQIEHFGKACCKHSYAVLNQLGFGSLADYVESRKLAKDERDWMERELQRHLAASAY